MPEAKDSNFEQEIAASLQRQPHLFLRLMQNSLTVAESLRDNYFKNTTRFVSHLKQRMLRGNTDAMLTCFRRSQPIQSTGGSASEFGRGREISSEILNAVQNGKQVICGL